MAIAPIFVGTPKIASVQLSSGTGTTVTTIATAGSSGSKIVGLIATSADTAANNLTVYRTNAGTNYPLGTVTLPAGAGSSGATPSVDVFNAASLVGLPIDSDGNHYIFLNSTADTLTANVLTTISTLKVTITAIYGDF